DGKAVVESDGDDDRGDHDERNQGAHQGPARAPAQIAADQAGQESAEAGHRHPGKREREHEHEQATKNTPHGLPQKRHWLGVCTWPASGKLARSRLAIARAMSAIRMSDGRLSW